MHGLYGKRLGWRDRLSRLLREDKVAVWAIFGAGFVLGALVL